MIVLWLLMLGFNQSSFSFLFKYYYLLYFIQFEKNNFQTLFFILFLIGSAVVSHSRILQNKWSFLLWYAFRDLGWQQRYARFCGRVVVLSILSLLLYPFLWAWTIIGTLWFTSARDCVSISFSNFFRVHSFANSSNSWNNDVWLLQLPEEGQKWGFLIWLLFSYCGLLCIACMSMGKVSFTFCTLCVIVITLCCNLLLGLDWTFTYWFSLFLISLPLLTSCDTLGIQNRLVIFTFASICFRPYSLNSTFAVADTKASSLNTCSAGDSCFRIWGKFEYFLHTGFEMHALQVWLSLISVVLIWYFNKLN